MSQKENIVGFVRNKDGFWWIISNDEKANIAPSKGTTFRSTGDTHGTAILRDIKCKWMEKHTPDFADYLKWIRLSAIRLACEALYVVARKLTKEA